MSAASEARSEAQPSEVNPVGRVMAEIARRDFLKLVGVGASGAAAAGCAEKVEQLIPYVVQPDEIVPGIAKMSGERMVSS